jgi:hypothetical protein
VSKNAKGFVWLLAVAANVAVVLYFLFVVWALAQQHDAKFDRPAAVMSALCFGVPALSLFALWTLRPRA